MEALLGVFGIQAGSTLFYIRTSNYEAEADHFYFIFAIQ